MRSGSQTLPSRLPLVQAPMAGGPSTPELAAAVAAAGGFGFVAGGYLDPEALRAALDRTRELTDAPIGVNLFVPSPDTADRAALARYAEELRPEADRLGATLGDPRWDDDAYAAKVDVAVAAGVHTLSLTFGVPSGDVVARLHAAGVQVAVTVTSRAQAEAAGGVGADLLLVQGTEAGGHQGGFGEDEPNRTPLLEALATIRSVDLPMIACGGLASAADLRAALDAGAIAGQVGTALLCTPEAGTSTPYRQALLDQRFDDTVLTRAFSGRWARGLANRLAREHPDAPAGYPHVHHLTRSLRAAATAAGDPEVMNLWAGTGWREAEAAPAAQVVQRLTARL
jgi:nitronate monooxygenase